MANEQANVKITLNSQEAQRELEKLQKEMRRLVELKKKAEKKGDISAYKSIEKQLKSVNRQASKLTREHQDLNKVLNNLSGASFNDLRKAQSALTSQTNKLNRNTDEYTKKRAQLKLVKQQIAGINNEYRMQQSLVSRLASGFNKYSMMIASIAATFGGLMLGARSAIDDFFNFEQTASNLKALTGLGADEMAYLEKQAKKTSVATVEGGVRIKQSAEDIVDAYTLVGSKRPVLLKNKEALHEVTQEAIILSEAAKMKLEPAAGALAITLNQFRLSSNKARDVINSLAAGSQAGAGNIEYLSQAIEKAGTTAMIMGLSVEETVGAVETLAPFFAEASQAGNTLDKTLLLMRKQNIGFQSGVFDMNDAILELEERFKKGETAVDLFGVRHAKAAELLVLNRDEYLRYTEAVTGTNKAIEQASINTDNNAAKLEQAKNRIKLVRIELGEKLAPAYRSVIKKGRIILKTLSALIDIFSKYGRVIIRATAAIIAYSVALKVAANWTKIQGAYLATTIALQKAYAYATALLTGKIKLATAAQQAWNLAQKANPIGLLTGLLAGAGVALFQYHKKAKKAAEGQKEYNEELEKTEELLGRKRYEQFLKEIGVYTDKVITLADGSKQVIKSFNENASVLDKFGEKVKSLRQNELEDFKQFFENEIVNIQRNLEHLDPDSLQFETDNAKIKDFKDALALVNEELLLFKEAKKGLDDDDDNSNLNLEEANAALELAHKQRILMLTEQYGQEENMQKFLHARLLANELAYLQAKAQMESDESKQIDLQLKILDVQQKYNQAIEQAVEPLRLKKQAVEEVNTKLLEEDKLLAKIAAGTAKAARQQDELNKTLLNQARTYQDTIMVVSDSLFDMMEGGEDAFQDFAKNILIFGLEQLKIQAQLAAAGATVQSLAQPDSIATFGATGLARAAIIVGLIEAAFAAVEGIVSGSFYEGGHTGPGGRNEPAGIVHKKEYVIPESGTTNPKIRPFIDILELNRQKGSLGQLDLSALMNAMPYRGFASGGYPGTAGSANAPSSQEGVFRKAEWGDADPEIKALLTEVNTTMKQLQHAKENPPALPIDRFERERNKYLKIQQTSGL